MRPLNDVYSDNHRNTFLKAPSARQIGQMLLIFAAHS